MKAIIQPHRLQILVLLGALLAATAGYADIDVWTGAVNGNWDTYTMNWRSLAMGTNTNFADGSPVLFNDTAIGPTTVNLTTNVFPGSVTFSNNSLSYVITGGAISGAAGLTLLGFGSVALDGTNNYTGPTTIGAGTLVLGNSNGLGSASSIIIADGATLDLSNLGTYATYTLGASASLTASGDAIGAVINGGASGTVSLGSSPVILNYFGSNPSLYLEQGSLSLNGNPFTVSSPSPLANGSYPIISVLSGSIITNSTPFPLVAGSAVGEGQYGFISVDVIGENVLLNIQHGPLPPSIVTQPQGVTVLPGTNVTLTFQAGGTGPLSYQWLLNGVRIAGATSTSLTLTNVQPSSGGSFSVNVQSPFGVTNSDPAVVLVICPSLYLADDFSAAPLLQGSQMVGSANNLLATEETGEPNHDGKNGQHSVWMAWQPQGTGIATFFTLGSAFDTTLAVYTNIAPSSPAYVSQLAPVAADDDSGPYLTSAVQFNAVPGQTYYIAADGYGPAAGNIVLSWSLLTTKKTLPVIVQQPLSCVAGFGDTVTFTVQANDGKNGTNDLSYQWQVDGMGIAQATNSALTLQNVQATNVGNYVVQVGNGYRSVLSVPAFLQISAIAPDGYPQLVQATYKLGDQLSVGTGQTGSVHIRDEGLGSPPVSGISGTHYFSTTSTPTSAAWFSIRATNDGPMLITTEGSGFSNNFTVFSGPSNAISVYQLTNLKTAITNGYELTSRTNITAVSNTCYYVEVFGNGTASGKATLNWAFNYSAAITRPPAGSILGTPGAVLTDSLDPPDAALWSTNQTTIPGPAGMTATQQPLQSAIYGVVNTSGASVTRDLVYQDVSSANMSARISGGNVIINYGPNTAGRTIYIESSPYAIGLWTVIKTLGIGALAGSVTESVSADGKFYRFSLTNP
jgi:autotransporter-associated beta strand protein